MMKILVRPVVVSDAGAIVSLLNPIILGGKFTSMTELMTLDDQVGFIETLPPNGIYLAAIDEATQRLVGIQDVLPKENDSPIGVISTFVSFDSVRIGIGRMLIDETFAVARSFGFEKLQAIIRSDNKAAVEFYRRMGFEMRNPEFDTICVSGNTIPRVLEERRVV